MVEALGYSHHPIPSFDSDRWKMPLLAVHAMPGEAELQARARALAAELELPVIAEEGAECDLLVAVTADGLELREVGGGAAGGVKVDLGGAGGIARRLAGASRRQAMARAVGLKKHVPTVVDATAGLGRDAMVLAGLGCRVTAIERSPIIGAMLRDAMERAPARYRDLMNRITLVIGDAAEILTGMSADEAPDVVYLDPMYPPKGKSALPKKEMRILRLLVGDDPDAGSLLAVARQVARDRVVVKRAPRTPVLAPSPTMTYAGKLARYDVYLRRV